VLSCRSWVRVAINIITFGSASENIFCTSASSLRASLDTHKFSSSLNNRLDVN
jgi:hypothetical protein